MARREEIKWLLVLALEETVRAELEAKGDFGYGINDGFDGYRYSNSVPKVAAEEMEVEYVAVAEVEVSMEVDVKVPPAAAVLAPRRLQYQCEVCLAPTTTRCARCKAFHY